MKNSAIEERGDEIKCETLCIYVTTQQSCEQFLYTEPFITQVLFAGEGAKFVAASLSAADRAQMRTL